jgi:hypothetical protein
MKFESSKKMFVGWREGITPTGYAPPGAGGVQIKMAELEIQRYFGEGVHMKGAVALLIGVAAALGSFACQSHHEEGVTSSYHSQWTDVAADTRTTTEAAKAVLESQSFKDVKASSTTVDGTAEGKKADGTVISVSIKKADTGSQVSVTVGTLGDPALGAELAKKIKDKAEGH